MKQLALFFFLLSAVFLGSFSAARFLPFPSEPLAISRFQPTLFPLKNHRFVIVIAALNNGASAAKMLGSVFSQNYELYRVIYVDDASDDGSFDLASDLIDESGKAARSTLLRNETRLGEEASLRRAVQMCEDDEIVVVLRGADWLAHEWVLQRLNGYYADPDLWFTSGQVRLFPTYQLADAKREPQTFYAKLFKQGAEGQVFQENSDHRHFIPETLYIAQVD